MVAAVWSPTQIELEDTPQMERIPFKTALTSGKRTRGRSLGVSLLLALLSAAAFLIPLAASATATVTEYPLPKESLIEDVATDFSGNQWFTDYNHGKIGKITSSGTITEYASKWGVKGITYGPEGNMWFTGEFANKFGKITSSGTITEYALPAGSKPYGITSDPSRGLVWFTMPGTNKIGRYWPKGGTIAEFSLPAGCKPHGIVPNNYGINPTVWYACSGTSTIGVMTEEGKITAEYSLPEGSAPDAMAWQEERIWFTEPGTDQIGMKNTVTSPSKTTQYALPESSKTWDITAAIAGDTAWFTDYGQKKIGSVNASTKVLTEYALPTGVAPLGASVDESGSVWFGGLNGNNALIGKFTP
jgi:virginiamycin B lyase